MFCHHPRAVRHAGFTLLELIVVVTIIGLLCAIAIPSYQKLKERSANTLVANELRVASAALEHYVFEQGDWPPDGAGSFPAELTGYLSPPERWNQTTPIGGSWAWALNNNNPVASLRINNYTAHNGQLASIDQIIDNNDLASGQLMISGQSLIYILQQ